MDYTQGLCNRDLSLVLGQSIQFMEYTLYLAFPQELLRELLCEIVSHGQYICDGALTEPPFFNLFRRQGKHREQFHHNLDVDIRHYWAGRECHIYIKTIEETLQAFKKFKQCVVTCGNLTDSLTSVLCQ
jgi:hypothetical protein